MWLIALSTCLCVSLAIKLKIGILALQGNQQVMTQWNQTFEKFLPDKIDELHDQVGLDVNLTHINFEVVPLGFQEIFDVTSALGVDLLYANPLIFACLERELGVRSILTVENARLGLNQSSFGGVIFTRADSDIFDLQDVKGRIFSAVDFTSLGGFQAAWVSFSEAGLNPFLDPSMMTFAITHDEVVRDVINKVADVGTVRTDTLEKWFGSPSLKLNRSQVRILTPQHYPGFPFNISTHLYPEWPLGVVTAIDESILRDIVRAMMELSPDPLGSYSRWIAPLSYESLHKLLDEVNIINQTDKSLCIRPDNVYDSVVCPKNYYKISSAAFATSCARANLTCVPGRTCACGACHLVPPRRFQMTAPASSVACEKMQTCTTIEELDSVEFTFEDKWRDILSTFEGVPIDSVQYRVNDKDIYDWVNATRSGNFFKFTLHPTVVGTHIVEVAVNGQQIDDSPFILRVKTKTCTSGYFSDRGVCILPQHNFIGLPAKVFGWSVVAVSLLSLFSFIIWVVINRLAKPIAASQPFFLGVMVLGCTLTLLSVFPASMDDENMGFPPRSTTGDFSYPSLGPACEAQVWLYSLGFCFTFGALFAKVNRIRRVYQTKVLHRIRITIADMLPQTLALVLIMAFLKLGWTLSDSYKYRRIVLDTNEDGDILVSVGKCTSSTDSEFLAIIIALQVACYVYGLYLCWVTRSFRAEFNESRYVTFCMVNNAQVLLLGAPLAVLVADRPLALFLVKVFVVLLTVAGQIVFLFAPKIVILYQKGANAESFERSSKQSGPNSSNIAMTSIAHPRGSTMTNVERITKETEEPN